MYHRWIHFGTLPPHSGDVMVLDLDFLIHKIELNNCVYCIGHALWISMVTVVELQSESTGIQ